MNESGLILNQENLLSLRTRFEESNQSSSTFTNSTTRRRRSSFNSGELRIIFAIYFHKHSIGLMIVGRHAWQQEEEQKRRYQCCTDISGTSLYFRSLQGHSGRNLIDPSLKDNVRIQSGFFQHIYHIGCAF